MTNVRTDHYEFSTGHAPRGRGSWAFGLTPNATRDQIFWASACLTFGEAKKEAIAHFGRSTIIFVLS